MEPGPATVRAHEPLDELLARMARRHVDEISSPPPKAAARRGPPKRAVMTGAGRRCDVDACRPTGGAGSYASSRDPATRHSDGGASRCGPARGLDSKLVVGDSLPARRYPATMPRASSAAARDTATTTSVSMPCASRLAAARTASRAARAAAAASRGEVGLPEAAIDVDGRAPPRQFIAGRLEPGRVAADVVGRHRSKRAVNALTRASRVGWVADMAKAFLSGGPLRRRSGCRMGGAPRDHGLCLRTPSWSAGRSRWPLPAGCGR